jgi:DNA-binding transcriptional ArsR family regulator
LERLDRESTVLAAEWLYRTRRERAAHFPAGLFAEPSWDILLDLYVAAATAREVSVSSSCIASASPATTALRHLANLEAAGLVHRRQDSRDPRRSLVELTPDAMARMEAFLRTILQPGTGA